jgi:hypothetical protein
MCQPPLFPGQYNNKDGNFEVSFSINGQDTSKWSQDCNLDVCREYLYGLPEHPDIVFRNQIITVTVLSVTIIYLYLYRQRQLKKNAKYVADTGGPFFATPYVGNRRINSVTGTSIILSGIRAKKKWGSWGLAWASIFSICASWFIFFP